jgi:hypothetical protein
VLLAKTFEPLFSGKAKIESRSNSKKKIISCLFMELNINNLLCKNVLKMATP